MKETFIKAFDNLSEKDKEMVQKDFAIESGDYIKIVQTAKRTTISVIKGKEK